VTPDRRQHGALGAPEPGIGNGVGIAKFGAKVGQFNAELVGRRRSRKLSQPSRSAIAIAAARMASGFGLVLAFFLALAMKQG
jgi:hypothetical protein